MGGNNVGMFTPPPLPPWEGLHPIVVHFPIAVLLLAPLLVIASMLWRKSRTPLALAALVALLVGTGAAQVAVMTGESAGKFAEGRKLIAPAADAVLEEHEELAEKTRTAFAVFTLAFGALVIVTALVGERVSHRTYVIGAGIALLGMAAGSLMLANTAHLGGRLVHEFGVRAPITGAASAAQPGAGVAPSQAGKDDDD